MASDRDEGRLQGRRIAVDDLPLAALRRRLEMLGQLNASALEDGSITADLVADEPSQAAREPR